MKFSILTVLAGLSSLVSAKTAATDTSIPKSTDAHSFLSDVWAGETATPTWMTGKYVTKMATALYSVETSFVMRDDYKSIISDIWSAASKDGGSEVVASMSSSGFDWGAITTNGWYENNVHNKYQTAVVKFDEAWDSAFTSVEAKATATGNAAAPRCTGMAVAGVALGVAAVAGVM